MRQQLSDYLEHGRGLNLSPLTLRAVQYNVTSFLDWLAAYRIAGPDQLRRTHLSAWLTHLQEHRTTRGLPLKPRSINKKIENVRGFLLHLAAEGLIASALAASVEYVKEPKLLPSSVMTHDQVRKLLRSIRTDGPAGYRDRALLELLYSTGIRAGEVLGLDVAHIDVRNATALVYGKGRKERVVPIGRTALRYTESYLTAVRPFLALDRTEQALFLDARGNRLPYHLFRRLVHKYAEACGIAVNVTPHTFRRSCTTELLRSGANMYHVKELLGHESLDTLKHYARLTITDLRETHRKCHPRERGTP
jgi:site-specific recombinase XerD